MMKNLYSRREIIKEFKLTKRIIETYEKKGLIQTSSHNKYGHNLYDEKQVNRLILIRLLQQGGLSLTKIKYIIDLPRKDFITNLALLTNTIKIDIANKNELLKIIDYFINNPNEVNNLIEIFKVRRNKQ